MKIQLYRMTLYSIIVYLTIAVLNPSLAVSSQQDDGEPHFCGVRDLPPDGHPFNQFPNRRYARTLTNSDVGEPDMVRLIYFLANDRPAQKDIKTILDGQIKRVQQFYENEMERHGFGKKTFNVETNAAGKAVVHQVNGQFASTHYFTNPVMSEISQQFDLSRNIYLVVVDIGRDRIFTGTSIDLGGYAHIDFSGKRLDEPIYLTLRGLGYVIAHELGHAFGLGHDFRNPVYIMAYNSLLLPRLSKCAAEWLDVHRYFNPNQPSSNHPPTIRILSPTALPPSAISLLFEVNDADGLHQAQLFVPSTVTDPAPGMKLQDCRSLTGQSNTIEFITTELTAKSTDVIFQVIDDYGNWTSQTFSIDITALLPERVATIPDANLAGAVRQALHMNITDSFTQRSMSELTRLTGDSSNIADLAGLEHAKHLTHLNLGDNQISDLSPLAGSTNLTFLYISVNSVSDVSPLSGLTNLTLLNLAVNSVSDVSPLSGLTNLISLDLAGNSISDVSPLSGLTDLESLSVFGNSVSDVSPLSGLTNLISLDLAGNSISDVSPLLGLTNLESLNLRNNSISDLSPLLTHTLLAPGDTVDVRGNPLSNMSINSHIPALVDRGVTVKSDHQTPTNGDGLIPDVNLAQAVRGALRLGPNDDLTQEALLGLTWLYAGSLQISTLTGIEFAANLRSLNIEDNAVSDLSALSDLTNLEILDIGYNSASELSALSGLTNLTNLNLSDNSITDLSVLSRLTKLRQLYIRNNPVSDISALASLTNLIWVDLERNSISDLSPLVANTGLGLQTGPNTVNVKSNPLSRASVKTHIPALQNRGITVRFDNRILTNLVKILGDNQQGVSGAALIKPFVVEVRDQTDQPLPGAEVTFSVTGGEGMLSRTSATTDSNGQAESTLTLGPNPGTNTVTVSVTGLQGQQTFSAKGIQVAKTLVLVSGDKQQGPPGAALANPFVVEVRDQADTLLPGAKVTFSVTGGGGTLSATSATTDNNGRAESTLTLGPNPGTNTVTVSVTGIQEKQTFNAEGIRIPKTLQRTSGDDQQGPPGAVLANPFVVEVRDQTDTPLPGAEVTFLVTGGEGTLSATSATTNSNGRAESTLTLGPNPGTNTVTVSVTGIQGQQTFNAEGIEVANTLVLVSGDDQQGLPGAALENPFVVEVRNQTGTPLSGVAVTFSATGGEGTLSATSVTTNSKGQAESTLTLGPNPGTNTVTVSVKGLQGQQTFSAKGILVAKALVLVSGDNQQGLPGAALENPFVVEVRDQTDKPLPGAEVTFSVTSGEGTLSATSATTNSKGQAESTLTLGPNPGANTVTVSVTGIQEQQTFNAKGIRTPKNLVIISGDKQQGPPGVALENPFVVEVRDQTDTPLPGAEVTFSVTGEEGTLSATSVTTNSNGQAESTLTLGPNPGTNTVTVSVTGIQEQQTFSATGIRIPKTLQRISGDDQQGPPGAVLENPFVVEVRDQIDKPLPDVQVTFSVTGGGGSLSATSATTDSDGQAESTLTLGPSSGTNTVSVSVEGIQEKQTFNAKGLGIPKTLQIISGDDQWGQPEMPLENPFVAEVQDQFDKPLSDVQVSFLVTRGGGTLSATSATTDSRGRAESTLTLGPNTGTNTVIVSVTEIPERHTIRAEGIRIPLAFWIISGFGQQGRPGTTLKNPFVVEARARTGEPLAGVRVMFSVTSGGGALSITSAMTDGNGRAESTLTLGANEGTNTVTVSVTGIREGQTVTAIAKILVPQDVNMDDVVNILDLVSVASNIGDEGTDLAADVNGDGVVNILDLVMVAGAIGAAGAAPSAHEIEPLTADEVQRWLNDARSLADKDAMIRKGIVILEQLLAALTPTKTALLLNFPNPFNPETWIPYQLAESANVTLTIHDSAGAVVRRIDLGHQSAGYYTDRTRAAYWDGRNASGETVTSGLYFYQLATPSYRQLRRMVILK